MQWRQVKERVTVPAVSEVDQTDAWTASLACILNQDVAGREVPMKQTG